MNNILFFSSPYIALLLCMVLIYRTSFFNIQGFSRLFIFLLFLIKAVCGCIIEQYSMEVLTGTDSDFYFASGKALHYYAISHPLVYLKLLLGMHGPDVAIEYFNLLNWKNLPLFNDGETMLKLNSLMHFVSFSNSYTHSIYFSFFSFAGLTGIFKVVSKISATHNHLLFALFILFPSLLIFTSGNLKEALLTGAVGLFLYSILYLQTGGKKIILSALFFFALFFIKPHFILFLIPVIAAYIICHCFKIKKLLQIFIHISIAALYFVTASIVIQAITHKSIPYTLALTQQSAKKNAVFKRAGSYAAPPVTVNSYASVTKNIPAAFIHAIAHPRFSSNKTLPVNLSALENLLMIVLLLAIMIACLIKRNMFFSYHLSIAAFVCMFYTLIGFTQSLEGIILRFKAPLIPLLISGVYLLIIQIRKRKEV